MSVTIHEWQRNIHMVTEAASVVLVPVVFAAAHASDEPHASRLKMLALGMLIVDGFLLLNWIAWRKS